MTAVLAWGKVDCEALGFDNSDTNGVTVPCQVHALGNTKVRSVSCGEKHTLICLEDGSIQSCGANDFKQCGRSTAKLKLGEFLKYKAKLLCYARMGCVCVCIC